MSNIIPKHLAYDLLITPETAASWLQKNPRNRHIAPSTVQRLAYAMKTGQFHYDGAPIRRDAEGNVLDGQHRLSAVVQAGTPILFHVIDGIDPKTQFTMDTGRKRSLSDALQMNGELSSKAQAAIVNAAYRWYILNLRSAVVFGGAGQYGGGNVQMDELLEFHSLFRQEFEFAAVYADQIRRVLPVSSRQVGLLAWIIVQKDWDQARDFLERLTDGAGLEKGSPILALRNLYVTSRGEKVSSDNLRLLSFGIKAWNLHRKHKSVTILRLPTTIQEAI